jgi:alkylation response protein AidB-like acyl-CoA dehydrogenase
VKGSTVNETYELSPAQLPVLERAKTIARDVLAPQAAENDREAKFPRAAIRALGEAGLLGLTIPKAQGGLGEGPRTFVAVVETLARADASAAMVYVMHVCATQVILARPPKDGDKLIREIAAGRHLSTLAFSEKGSRSHFWAPVSKERKDGEKLLLDADKSMVTSAGEADSYVVSCLAWDAKTPTASDLWLVRSGVAGMTVPSKYDGMGLRGNASAPMALRNVALAEGDRICAPGAGFDAMLGIVLPWFQTGNAAMSVGNAEAALQATANHVKNTHFEHLGEALSSLPNLRANVAKMRVEVERSRAQLAFAAKFMEAPGPHTMPAVLATKLQAGEMALTVTDLAMRTCGGAAFSRQVPVERCFRDARAASIMAPTGDVLLDFIGKAELGLPLF